MDKTDEAIREFNILSRALLNQGLDQKVIDKKLREMLREKYPYFYAKKKDTAVMQINNRKLINVENYSLMKKPKVFQKKKSMNIMKYFLKNRRK